MQLKPDLTLDDVMDILEHSCVKDDFTSYMPERWGFGKINAARGIEYMTGKALGIVHTESPEENAAIYDLQGRRVQNPARGLYIRNGKKYLPRW